MRGALLGCLLVMVAVCGGCGGYGENVSEGGGIPEFMTIQEARSMVCVLDHLAQNDKLEQAPLVYNQMGYIFTDPANGEKFKGYEETYDRLRTLVLEVKDLLVKDRNDTEPIKQRIQEMVELADDLPGDEIKLEEVWSVD